jgi:RsiW-degrading membrane proteinase PrsW (M82 family)
VGYSLAISFCQAKNKKIPVIAGLLTAMLLHGLYDFSIINLNGSYLKFSVAAAIILTLALLVFSGFEKIKKMKSVCKI